MAKGRKIDLGMKDVLDEMFMDDAGRKENRLPKIYDIPLDMIDDFPDHPFKVRLDEDMDQLVESIKERGLITPITLRQKDDGRYEIVSGHRRKKACEIAGLETVRAEIKELSRDEAIILMVESNLQRSVILPSEKAFSYKMRLEAMKRQGQRTDATLSPVATKLPIDSAAEIGAMTGESRDQVFRYIRLTNLKIVITCKGKTRTVLMPGKLKTKLLNYTKSRGISSGTVFVTRSGKAVDRSNIWREMKELCKDAGVSPNKVFRIT